MSANQSSLETSDGRGNENRPKLRRPTLTYTMTTLTFSPVSSLKRRSFRLLHGHPFSLPAVSQRTLVNLHHKALPEPPEATFRSRTEL